MNFAFSNTTPQTIGSGSPNTLTSTIEVTGVSGRAIDVDVLVDLSHTYTGDLEIFLTGPAGQRVALVSREGGSGNDFASTVFDDEASAAISGAAAPFRGRFRPEADLSAFDGVDVDGSWTLEVNDRAFADGGTLHRWALSFEIEEVNVGPFVFENHTPRTIDSGSPHTVVSEIDVQGLDLTEVGSVEVSVDIDHTYTADLTLTIIAPNGARAVLVDREGGSANNFRGTRFSMEATTPVTAGEAPFNGTFRPEGDLGVFEGIPANGTWQLEIRDNAWADGGSLEHWSLAITAQQSLPPKPSEFRIEVRFLGGLTSSQQQVFQEAAARWSDVIIGDLVAVNTDVGFVDDVVIDAEGSQIDGPGRVLGQAGPTVLRPGSLLPARGIMSFDSADLAQMESDGSLFDVIVHEMGHVLGFGTLWDRLGLIQGGGSSNPLFTGPNAMREYSLLIGANQPTPVPLANTGGAGTRDGHWRESTFGNELMTGFIDEAPNPVSRLTIAAFQDMGYQVSFDSSDSYQIPSAQLLAAMAPAQDRRCCQCSIPEPIVLSEDAVVRAARRSEDVATVIEDEPTTA